MRFASLWDNKTAVCEQEEVAVETRRHRFFLLFFFISETLQRIAVFADAVCYVAALKSNWNNTENWSWCLLNVYSHYSWAGSTAWLKLTCGYFSWLGIIGKDAADKWELRPSREVERPASRAQGLASMEAQIWGRLGMKLCCREGS